MEVLASILFILFSFLNIFPNHTSAQPNVCLNTLVPDESGVCGYNSICRLENGRPDCFCPRGFTFADPNNRFGNCKPLFTPTCDRKQESIVMLEETDVDWPLSDYHHMNPATKMQCNQTCFEDCFCVVSIFRSNQCWKKKFPLSNGRRDISLGATAFIKSSSRYVTHV